MITVKAYEPPFTEFSKLNPTTLIRASTISIEAKIESNSSTAFCVFSKVVPGGSVKSAIMIPLSSFGINPEGVDWNNKIVIPENTNKATTVIHFLLAKKPSDLTYLLFILSKPVLKAMKNLSFRFFL
ncbi:hypothetical protein D3C80_1568730 [compost metagenome]